MTSSTSVVLVLEEGREGGGDRGREGGEEERRGKEKERKRRK